MNERVPPKLLAIGDFGGFAKYVGKARRARDAKQRWRLMQVADRLYQSDVRLLERLQIQIYQPLIRNIEFVPRNKLSHSQRHSVLRPTREKLEPFFPGYIFLSFEEDDQRWREVFKMVRISGLVCAGGRAVEVPIELIEGLRAQEVDGAVPDETELEVLLSFLPGDKVFIVDGPFAGFPAEVEVSTDVEVKKGSDLTLDQLDESFRVGLLIDILGRRTRVDLPVAQIERMI